MSVVDITTSSNDDDDDDDFDEDYIDDDDDDDNDNDNDNNDDDDNTFEFDDDDSKDEPPMTVKVSDELCKVVFCSRYEGMCALDKLYELAMKITEEPEFLNSFHTNDGSIKIFDFLKATMNDSNCKILTRMKCIILVVKVIQGICCSKGDHSNKKDVIKILTSAVDCGGIDTLINASKECTGGGDVL